MLNKGAIRRPSPHPRPFVSNLFIVSKKTGDLRPVINLRLLFKMEGLSSLLDLLSDGEFLTTIYLKDAYF